MRFSSLLVLSVLLAVPLTSNAQRDSVMLRFDPIRDTVMPAQTGTIRIYPDKAISNAGIDAIQFTLRYLDDVLRCNFSGAAKIITRQPTYSGREIALPILIVGSNMSLDPSVPLLSITMEGMVTDTTHTQLRLTDLLVNPQIPSYSAVVLGADTGSVDVMLRCGNLTLQKFLRGVSLTTVYGVSPNPARDEIRVTASGNRTSAIQIAIFDAIGNLVLAPSAPSPKLSPQRGEEQIAVDVSSLASGMYFLRLSCDGYVQTRRVNVER